MKPQSIFFLDRVVRNAGTLNSAARTMLTEVQVDNRDASLLPRMYTQVKFTLPQQRTSLIIPTSSLVVDRSGMHVETEAVKNSKPTQARMPVLHATR